MHVADVTYEIRRDFARDAANITWVRDYLELPWPRMNKYVEVIADGVGFAIGNDGGPRTASLQAQGPERVMTGNRLATTKRELERTSPVLLLEMARRVAARRASRRIPRRPAASRRRLSVRSGDVHRGVRS